MLVLTFRIGSELLALDVRTILEVVPRVRLQRVAFGPRWLSGVFLYRGQVVPVVDLHHLVGEGDSPLHLSTRIIIVKCAFGDEERLIGLQAAQVADIREMQPHIAPQDRPADADRPDFGPVLVDGLEIVHLVDLGRLFPESYRRQLALVPKALAHEGEPRDRAIAGADRDRS